MNLSMGYTNLKRSKTPIPEEMKEAFPDHSSIMAEIGYALDNDKSTPFNPIFYSEVRFLLVPKNGGGRSNYKVISELDGPDFEKNKHKDVVIQAKNLIRDKEYMTEILREYLYQLAL